MRKGRIRCRVWIREAQKTCGSGTGSRSPTLLVIIFNSGFESVSDEDLSGESSTDGEEGKGGGAPPRRKLTKISDRDLSELKSDDGVTLLHFFFVLKKDFQVHHCC
jgi:hypothetical protein